MVNAGQDAPPTMCVESENVLGCTVNWAIQYEVRQLYRNTCRRSSMSWEERGKGTAETTRRQNILVFCCTLFYRDGLSRRDIR